MPVTIGGSAATRTWGKGDLGLALQHVNDEESLVIWRRHGPLARGAAVIGLSQIHRYFDSRTAMPTPYAADRVREMLPAIGFDSSDLHAAHRLLDALYESVADLVRMLPAEIGAHDAEEKALPPRGVEEVELRINGDLIAKH